jgi:hypothetical protein
VRIGLIGLNCETDFEARSALFGCLVADVVYIVAFLAEIRLRWSNRPPEVNWQSLDPRVTPSIRYMLDDLKDEGRLFDSGSAKSA